MTQQIDNWTDWLKEVNELLHIDVEAVRGDEPRDMFDDGMTPYEYYQLVSNDHEIG